MTKALTRRVQPDERIIVMLGSARQELAAAKKLQDAPRAKRVHDLAAAAERFGRQQQIGQESIDLAHSIKIEALRCLGEIVRESPKNKGAAAGGTKAGSRDAYVVSRDSTPTLADLGIPPKVSALAQKLIDLPETQYEQVRAGTVSVAAALREVEHAKRVNVPLPDVGTYRVVYADPPWSYGNSGVLNDEADNYGRAARHYPTMTIAELIALPIKGLLDADAVLFLWVTSPLLAECFDVIVAWGFTYKTSFVWDKVKHNFGHYNSVRHELLLVCTRGACTPDVRTLHDSVQTIERSTVHSEKPEEFRAIIDELYPRGTRIELFARRPAPAPWETWSNEGGATA